MNIPDGGLRHAAPAALRVRIGGTVQGVGFRPFIYRLAQAQQLTGWVRNSVGSVELHVQGAHSALQTFMRCLFEQAPASSEPVLESCTTATPEDSDRFHILDSVTQGPQHIHIPVDLDCCADCLNELLDPADRRYRYPFINCTQCGPRYTLIRELPYDRPSTTMQGFPMCSACAAQYENPADRRFHAEPVACPECGPQLEFHYGNRPALRDTSAALQATLDTLHQGLVVAVKGIGGYHLVCDATSDTAIERLRLRKPRPDKPLAVLCPSPAGQPLQRVRELVWLSRDEAELLQSPRRPIVLARKKPDSPLSELIAPGLNEVGVMLPYSPLHHLLLQGFDRPLVATSANISGEPVLTDNMEVARRLAQVTDACLHHNRPIARPADDPVYRKLGSRLRLLRPGRGCAPLELKLPFRLPHPVLAAGGQQKNCIALAWDDRIVISPHIGDMDSSRSRSVYEQTVSDLQALYRVKAAAVVCDAHPGYATSHYARRCGLPVTAVWHHHAHASCAVFSGSRTRPSLVFTWDGVGLGPDGTLWGGEALLGGPGSWQQFGTLRGFSLPGGERASREPWRSAAALCWETGLDWAGLPTDSGLLRQAWQQRLNTPRTSAAGRLFDAAAALTGTCQVASFEGQGPMWLEAASSCNSEPLALPLAPNAQGVWTTDWEPLLPLLMDEARPVSERGGILHATLAAALLEQARAARRLHGVRCVGLAGGVFQNRLLVDRALALLTADGFEVRLPEHVPVNDAGLGFGQVIEYAAVQGIS